MTSRLQQLTDQGVAVWVDSIARDWLQKGSCAACATSSR